MASRIDAIFLDSVPYALLFLFRFYVRERR